MSLQLFFALLSALRCLGGKVGDSTAFEVTIIEPFEGQVFVDSTDVPLVFSVRALQAWTSSDAPVAAVAIDGRTLQRVPITELAGGRGVGDVHERALVVELFNHDFNVSVHLHVGPDGEDPGGDVELASASATFSIDVRVELARIEEEEDERAGVEGGRQDFTAEDWQVLEQCAAHGLLRRNKPARIYDTFSFKDEIDLLQVRIEEIGDLVEAIVLVEASRTHQGAPREPLFAGQAALLPPDARRKILHVVEHFPGVTKAQGAANPWLLEARQRDAILRGLADARDTDLVIISDAGEIPKRSALLLLRVCQGYTAPVFMEAGMHYYGFHLGFAEPWVQGPKVAAVFQISAASGVKPTMVRHMMPVRPHGWMMAASAWHCSYFVRVADGSSEPLQAKLLSFAHTEWLGTNVTQLSYIEKMVSEERDLFEEHYGRRTGGLSRKAGCSCVELPLRVRRMASFYRHWIPHCTATAAAEEVEAEARCPNDGDNQGFLRQENVALQDEVSKLPRRLLLKPNALDGLSPYELQGDMIRPGGRESGGSEVEVEGTGDQVLQRAGYLRQVMAGCHIGNTDGAYRMDECLSGIHLDPRDAKSTSPHASNCWLDPLDFPEVYAGLETSVRVYLRDVHGRKLASCDEITAGALEIRSSGLEGVTSSCSDTESMVRICFVSKAPGRNESVDDLEDVVIRVLVGREDVSNSPYRVRAQPTWRASRGCVRPGVARLASSCSPALPTLGVGGALGDVGQVGDEETGAGPREAGEAEAGRAEAKGAIYSSMTALAQNLVSINNVCIHANHISVFPPPGGGDFRHWPRRHDGTRERVEMSFGRHGNQETFGKEIPFDSPLTKP